MPGTPPKRPYLLRAMHQWVTDSKHTPHVIIDAERPGVTVPRAFVKDGKIVLNLSFTATQNLHLGNEWIEFGARFAGVVHFIRVPISAVLGIYARETGEGMVFSDQDLGPEPPPPQPSTEEEGSRRSHLKLVK
jgi:stringent starvation protein B